MLNCFCNIQGMIRQNVRFQNAVKYLLKLYLSFKNVQMRRTLLNGMFSAILFTNAVLVVYLSWENLKDSCTHFIQ